MILYRDGKGMFHSPWHAFVHEAIQGMQRHYAKDIPNQTVIEEKEAIAKLRKEIFSERLPEAISNTDTSIQTPVISILKPVQEWIDPNARKPGEHFRTWGARLRKRYMDLVVEDPGKPENLNDCKVLYNDLIQYDPLALPPSPTKSEAPPKVNMNKEDIHDLEAGPGPATQVNREKTINEEFRRLGEITEEQEKDLEFREQELGMAVKRRAVAVYKAKVSKSHPDNGSDIRKILESRRKQFKELLEKEFDKRG
jgi:hypothetical protein